MKTVLKWGEPKPGYEFEYDLAMRHRILAGDMMSKISRQWWSIYFPSTYNRAFRLWADAMDRMKQYGQDIVREI